MAKKGNGSRQQVGVRLSSDAVALLEALQAFYTERAGVPQALSQSDTVEMGLRDLAKLHKLKGAK